MKIAFIMDPIENIIVNHDTSFAMMLEAERRGWDVFYCQATDMVWREGKAFAEIKQLKVFDDESHWFDVLSEETMLLGDFDIVMMRKDPPFDMGYIFATYFLDHAKKLGALVVNDPQSLRDANEKFFATHVPECMPETIIASKLDLLNQFHKELGDVIVKPLDGMGGTGIFKLNKGENGDKKLLALSKQQSTPIMMQRYLPEVVRGDKRILIINGKPISHALARIPQNDNVLANLAAGGKGVSVELTERDYDLCEQVAPLLKENGLYFVGLDVIGDYVTEINVTSPTCVRELDRELGLNICKNLFDELESHCHSERSA